MTRLLLLVALLAGCPSAEEAAAPTAAPAADVALYTCPMHPSIHQDHPGRCPLCGMDLVPVSRADAQAGAVTLDASTRERVGIRVEPVISQRLYRELRAAGTVAWDPTRTADASLRIDTWVRTVEAAPGERVEKGRRVLTVTAPELAATQAELLAASRAGQSALADAARQRLSSWGIAEADVDALLAAGAPAEAIAVRAPAAGVLVDPLPTAGSMVGMGMPLFRVARVDRVWVEAALPAGESAPRVGDPVRVRLPDAELETRVAAVLPDVDPVTRGPRFRVEVDRPLPAGQYVPVVLPVDLGQRLTVPVDAVIHAGDRTLVFVQRDDTLTPREVETGAVVEDRVEVRSGLDEGDVVVAQGAFLVSAESRLRSAGAW